MQVCYWLNGTIPQNKRKEINKTFPISLKFIQEFIENNVPIDSASMLTKKHIPDVQLQPFNCLSWSCITVDSRLLRSCSCLGSFRPPLHFLLLFLLWRWKRGRRMQRLLDGLSFQWSEVVSFLLAIEGIWHNGFFEWRFIGWCNWRNQEKI